MMAARIPIGCICKRLLVLQVVGGQYQHTYTGTCTCGRKWQLDEVTETGEEDDLEEEADDE